MRRRWELNPRIAVLQTAALPLRHGACLIRHIHVACLLLLFYSLINTFSTFLLIDAVIADGVEIANFPIGKLKDNSIPMPYRKRPEILQASSEFMGFQFGAK